MTTSVRTRCEGHPHASGCPHRNYARPGRRWCGLCDPDLRAARAADHDRRRRDCSELWPELVDAILQEKARAEVEGRTRDAAALLRIADLARRLAP